MKKSASYTMRDVARLAQVSVTTVSTIVNGRGGVSPDLVRRVEDAIATLDYHPNEVARSLKVNRTFIVGVVVPDVSNLFFNSILQGAETRARQFGYSVVLCDSHEDPGQELELLKTLISRRVDGILLASAQLHWAESGLAKRRPPIVCFDREPAGFTGPVVVIDNVLASYHATRYLIDLGHERIALIAGPEATLTGSGRIQGFRKAIHEAHISLPEEYIRNGEFTMEGASRVALEILRLPNPPTAVFSCNNRMTLGLMRALKALGLACPLDVSVCGFDDFDWSELFTPMITTVVQPSYKMGELATEMLLKEIDDSNQPHESERENRIVLKTELRVRESTAPPASLCGRSKHNSTLPVSWSSEATEHARIQPQEQSSAKEGEAILNDQKSAP